MLVFLATAWQLLTGTQLVKHVGALAQFSISAFQVLALVQGVVLVFLGMSAAVIAVGQEKERRTIDLLLLTELTSAELVWGKLLASVWSALMMLLAGAPVFMLLVVLGGVSLDQLVRMGCVTLAAVVACGSLGSTLALWREKTFQSLSLTAVAILGVTLLAEGALRYDGTGSLAQAVPARWIIASSPWHALLEAIRPPESNAGQLSAAWLFVLHALLATGLLNTLSVYRLRRWVLAQEPARAVSTTNNGESVHRDSVRRHTRAMWANPVLWREVRTWAYGSRTLLVRVAYGALAASIAVAVHDLAQRGGPIGAFELARPIVPLLVISLLLINAQAVTSLTSERDARALDLLLVTDLSPREFVFGKLGGILYNTREMVLAPLILGGYLGYEQLISGENLVYVLLGWLVLVAFTAMLGVHAGINYVHSPAAIAVSLGTLFFLVVGIAVAMRMMVAFSGSFRFQLQPFLAAMVGGGIALHVALGGRNPSAAIRLAALSCPFATFYALTSFLLNYPLAAALSLGLTYSFTTAAMLVPALFEFDVATGRSGDYDG